MIGPGLHSWDISKEREKNIFIHTKLYKDIIKIYNVCIYSVSFLLVCFVLRQSLYVVLAILELSMQSRMALNSQRSSRPCLQSAGIGDVTTTPRQFCVIS